MTDASAIRDAALTVGSSFLFGFAGFTFAFSAEFGGLGAKLSGLLLVLLAIGLTQERSGREAPEPSTTEERAATDRGGWEPES